MTSPVESAASTLTEYAQPVLVPYPEAGNLTDDVVNNAASGPNRVALRRRVGDQWIDVSAVDFLTEVATLAKGLIAAGIEPGSKIGLMSRTCYEWTLTDYAIWFAGAVTVPIYETSSAEQVEWILSDSEAVAVFLETDKHLATFEEVAAQLPGVKDVWVFDRHAVRDLGKAGADVADDELEARRSGVGPDDVATIIYTSGTTGRPKGCVLTHGNCMFDVGNVVQGAPELFLAENSSTLLFLPLAHVFGRLIQIGTIHSRTVLGHSADITNLLDDLGQFQPTFLLAVPRVFEKVYNGAVQKAAADGKSTIFEKAANTAIDYSQSLDAGGPGISLKLRHALFDKLVYGKLRARLGGRVEWAVSGGAPLGARLGHFFRGIGVTILEGYGLTETSAASTLNLPTQVRIGSVGRPIPGASVRIADDGEIMLAGGQIFQGYWNNAAATAEAIEPDGWFHSGDIGQLDSEGFLTITGRKKELLVTAGGKNVAPAVLEDRIRAHALVSQCMVVGDNKPFVAALITLDPESVPIWAEQHGKASNDIAVLASDPDMVAEIQRAVDDANKAVSTAESVRKFKILDIDWTEIGGELTPSLKLKRNVVMERFNDEVEGLYA